MTTETTDNELDKSLTEENRFSNSQAQEIPDRLRKNSCESVRTLRLR